MRITYRVFLVGGIPIAIAATIAAVAWILLNESERARDGAVLAGATYRNLLVAMTARDEYVNAPPANRAANAEQFRAFSTNACEDLEELIIVARAPALREAATRANEALTRYVASMGEFMDATVRNDRLIDEMRARAALLIALTDQARERQRNSNADIIATLRERDIAFRRIRSLVNAAEELRTAVAAAELRSALYLMSPAQAREDIKLRLGFDVGRLRNAVARLVENLEEVDPTAVPDLKSRALEFGAVITDIIENPGKDEHTADSRLAIEGVRISEWSDRIVKVKASEQRALYEEIAQLVAYSVAANETERSAQNIAIEVLQLGQRTTAALDNRDPETTAIILAESATLPQSVASLPISPLIQTEMIDALDQWREGLSTATEGLRRQNERIADMDRTAVTMIDGARALNDLFTVDADNIGNTIGNILIFGAAAGLLFGAVTGYFVVRSITRPLLRVQQGMVALAEDPQAGQIADAERADELGDMARAANFFVAEIGKREQDLRQAKDRADNALEELQHTQANLIQAEKLASLGQLVAGIAHEINTPIGIALTTGTQLGEDVRRFDEVALSGQLKRSQLKKFVERMKEGSRLLFTNLNRAAELVQSFKQVAADQTSGERRHFEMRGWLEDLMTSLGPVLRKSRHEVAIMCRDGLELNTYPGALSQVLTNLVMNSLTHGYDAGQTGRLTIEVTEPDANSVRIVFFDDGKGISAEHIGQVFDPFYTTGRSMGSTGLGLHIVFNLVTGLLQGTIEVDSKPETGTRFTIDFPVSANEMTADRIAAIA